MCWTLPKFGRSPLAKTTTNITATWTLPKFGKSPLCITARKQVMWGIVGITQARRVQIQAIETLNFQSDFSYHSDTTANLFRNSKTFSAKSRLDTNGQSHLLPMKPPDLYTMALDQGVHPSSNLLLHFWGFQSTM